MGWRGDVGVVNPLITFNFGSPVTVSSIAIQMDNSLTGGVGAPQAIWIDGMATAFTAPAVGTIGTVTIGGLNLTGASHTLQFFQDSTFVWTFVSEVSFNGDVPAVPEPTSWAMLLAGMGAVGLALRRSRRIAVSFG